MRDLLLKKCLSSIAYSIYFNFSFLPRTTPNPFLKFSFSFFFLFFLLFLLLVSVFNEGSSRNFHSKQINIATSHVQDGYIPY